MSQNLLVFLLLLSICARVYSECYRNESLRQKFTKEERNSPGYKPVELIDQSSLPKAFNWCDLDGINYCVPIWNQKTPRACGSCWVHGPLSMINDRIKIMKKGKGPDVMLGRQTMLNCAGFKGIGYGCDGGAVINALQYVYKYGLPHEDCMPYMAVDHTKYDGKGLSDCPAEDYCLNCMPLDGVEQCWVVKTPIMYYVAHYGECCDRGTQKEIVQAMMSEIFTNGPIACSIAVSDGLKYEYKGGIYRDDGFRGVNHDIEVVGWGEEDGLKYWIIRNSWGSFWGESGFFRLERGVNALALEEGDCWGAEPDISMENDVRNHKLVGSMYGVFPAKETATDFGSGIDA